MGSPVKISIFDDPSSKSSGRPGPKLDLLAHEWWEAMKTATESSTFFGPKAISHQRSLARYITVSSQKLLIEKSDEKLLVLRMCKKKFELMDQLVRIHLAWQGRKSVAVAATSFLQSWHTMIGYAALSDDLQTALEIQCPFMHRQYLSVIVASSNTELLQAMESSKLQTTFALTDMAKVAMLQVETLSDGLIKHLTSAAPTKDCKMALENFVEPFINASSAVLEREVQEDLHDFYMVLSCSDPESLSSTGMDATVNKQLAQALSQIPQAADHKQTQRPYFLPLLVAYPRHGKHVASDAQASMAKREKLIEVTEHLFAQVEQLGKTPQGTRQ